MDTISYGIANKVKDAEANLRNKTLSTGVEGKSKNVKERIDSLEKYLEGLSLRANKLIVTDAVNIMKAHAKLNVIAKTLKYNMQNMMFDDLLDTSGIDKDKSSGYSHDTQFGFIQSNSEAPCIIETVAETVQSSPAKVILLAEEQKKKTNNYGMKFNGKSSHIVIPDWTTGPDSRAFTCELTVTLDSTKNQAFVAYNEDKIICGYYGNKVHLRLINTTIDGIALQIGKEYKLRYVIEFDGIKSYLRIYVDGQLVVSGESQSVIPSLAKSWSIGQETDGGSHSDFVDGTLADIRLWEKVTDTVGTELSGNEEGLLLYYDFAEGEGAEVIDKSFNKRDGQAKNTSYVELTEGESAVIGETSYFISRDNGETWTSIIPENLFYFDNKTIPAGTQLKVKAIIPPGVNLLNYALTWA